jgi:TRAP-type uncharacterized transport system substrate-binding protein
MYWIGAMAFLLAAAAGAAELPADLPFAGGPAGGFYQEVAAGVAAEVPGVRALSTAGSVKNLELLETEKVRFALAQQDVLSEYLAALAARGEPSQIRGIGRVFFDYLHIFVRAPLHVEEASEFRRFLVWPGAEGSGTRRTAVRFLESVGVPETSLRNFPGPLKDLVAKVAAGPPPPSLPDLFGDGGLDVAMIMGLPGSDLPCRVMASGRAELFPLDYRTLRIFTSEQEGAAFRRQVVIANLPADTYRNQPQVIPTVAVPVLLLALEGEDPRVAARVLEAARRRWAAVAGTQGAAGCRRIEELPATGTAWMANLEPLVGFKPSEDRLAKIGKWALLALLALALVAGGARLWRSGPLREGWNLVRQERVAVRILGSLALGAVLITFLTYLLEHRINENFSTPWESAWSITVYLFSGLEDRTPYTPAGRLVAAFGLVLGPLFFAFLTGWLAGVFIQWEKRMPQNLRNHVLLVNWNERAVQIVQELHHELLSGKDGMMVIVVLTNDDSLTVKKLKESGVGREGAFEDFYVTVGDPTSERALRNANAQDARSVVLLADDADPGQADARSIRTLVMLRRIAKSDGVQDLHVVVELADPGNSAVLEDMAEDFPGLLEWVSGVQVRTCLLAQATLSHGVTAFYRDLLRVSGDTNEVYVVAPPPSALGASFREYAARVVAGNGRHPVIPVGVQRSQGGRQRIFTNPRPGEPGATLEEGDLLVVVSHEPPDPALLPGGAG